MSKSIFEAIEIVGGGGPATEAGEEFKEQSEKVAGMESARVGRGHSREAEPQESKQLHGRVRPVSATM